MSVRTKAALAILLGASLLLGGVAGAADNGMGPRPDWDGLNYEGFKAQCALLGGRFVYGPRSWSCELPDGTTIDCDADAWGKTKDCKRTNIVAPRRPGPIYQAPGSTGMDTSPGKFQRP